VEQGPTAAPILLMTLFAIPDDAPGAFVRATEADAAIGCGSMSGRTEGGLSEKISILITAYGSTAGCAHRLS